MRPHTLALFGKSIRARYKERPRKSGTILFELTAETGSSSIYRVPHGPRGPRHETLRHEIRGIHRRGMRCESRRAC